MCVHNVLRACHTALGLCHEYVDFYAYNQLATDSLATTFVWSGCPSIFVTVYIGLVPFVVYLYVHGKW